MNKFLFSSLIALLFVGCATTANYEKMLQTTIGMSENDLVAKFGLPQGSYENEGIRYLTYSRSEFIPGVVVPPSPGFAGFSTISYTVNCSVTFTVVNKQVAKYQYKGNDCKA